MAVPSDDSELLSRLDRLAPHCHLKVEVDGGVWRIQIKPHGGTEEVTSEADQMLVAAENAVQRAEALGWHRPPTDPPSASP